MTVSTTTPFVQQVYTGPGAYAFTFPVTGEEDLLLTHFDAVTGAATVLILTTDYTVVLGDPGGTCTLLYAPTTGTLEIRRATIIDQDVDWVNNDPFDMDILETAIDKLTMVDQEQKEILARTIRLDYSETDPGDLPTPVADAFWRWNATGDAVVWYTYAELYNLILNEVQAAVSEVIGNTAGEPNGFSDYDNEVTLTWDNPTRTLTIAPQTTSFQFYSNGLSYTKTSSEQIQIADTEGEHFIYYDDDGELAVTNSFEDNIIRRWAFVLFVYWDATNNEAVPDALIETHGTSMSSVTHAYLHTTVGTAYESGLLPSLTADGDGSADAHAQTAAASGIIWDEDIKHTLSARALGDNLIKLYKDGASGVWRMDDDDAFVVTTTGTGRAAWNEWTGAVWQLTELTNNDFVLAHFFAIPGLTSDFAVVIGQADYATISAACAAALTEVQTLDLAGLPFTEAVLVATIIIQSSNSYVNTPKSRIRTTDSGDDFIQWARAKLLSAAGQAGSGGGDVLGPASATANGVALFDGVSGKLLKDSTVPYDGSAKATPVDADGIALQDSADSSKWKWVTWANVKSVIQTAFNTIFVRIGTTSTLTVGYTTTPYNAGTKSTGTYTPAAADGQFQYAVNGGAHTLAPPANNTSVTIQYTNNASAGAITTSGFTKVTGDTITTTDGDDFMFYITRNNGFSHLHVQALQ